MRNIKRKTLSTNLSLSLFSWASKKNSRGHIFLGFSREGTKTPKSTQKAHKKHNGKAPKIPKNPKGQIINTLCKYLRCRPLRDVHYCNLLCYPPASKASREVANLTERKNAHILVYGVKEFFCLSVCLSVTN